MILRSNTFSQEVFFEGNHKFHAIYTAYNRDFAAQGKDAQVLMSAESDDLLNWKKTGKFVLPAPEGYDGNDWRDPFILWEEESQQYKIGRAHV